MRFCCFCGSELFDDERTRFCVACGADLSTYLGFNNNYKNISSSSVSQGQLWSFKFSLLISIVSLILVFLVSYGIIELVIIFSRDLAILDNNIFLLAMSILEIIFLSVPILAIGPYLQKPSLKNRFKILGLSLQHSRKYEKHDILKELLIGIIFAIIALFVVGLISLLMYLIFNGAELSVDDPFTELSILDLVLGIIVMLLVVGPSEEFLFRGFMQKGLVRSKIGEWGGIIIVALFFALIHIIEPVFDLIIGDISLKTFGITFLSLLMPYLAISFLLGLIFRWRKENLLPVIIMHSLYNTFILIITFVAL